MEGLDWGPGHSGKGQVILNNSRMFPKLALQSESHTSDPRKARTCGMLSSKTKTSRYALLSKECPTHAP